MPAHTRTHTHTRTYTHIHTHSHTHTQTHTNNTHTHTHTYTHAHTQTHTHTRTRSRIRSLFSLFLCAQSDSLPPFPPPPLSSSISPSLHESSSPSHPSLLIPPFTLYIPPSLSPILLTFLARTMSTLLTCSLFLFIACSPVMNGQLVPNNN